MTNAMLAQQRLKADATNRGVRTFVQGFYIDLAVTIAMFILANVSALDITDRAAVITVALSFVKTILTAFASYVVRMYGDKSNLPTGPAPPEDPGPPAVEVDEAPPSTAIEANDLSDDRPAIDLEEVDPSLLTTGGLETAITKPVKKAPRKEVVAKRVSARKATPKKKP